jgi:hypothetical protein
MIQRICEMSEGYWQTIKDPLTREDLPATLDYIVEAGFNEQADMPRDVLAEHDAEGAISILGHDELYLYWY